VKKKLTEDELYAAERRLEEIQIEIKELLADTGDNERYSKWQALRDEGFRLQETLENNERGK